MNKLNVTQWSALSYSSREVPYLSFDVRFCLVRYAKYIIIFNYYVELMGVPLFASCMHKSLRDRFFRCRKAVPYSLFHDTIAIEIKEYQPTTWMFVFNS